MEWVSAVPHWAWIALAALYGLAASGWYVALYTSDNDANAARFWALIWPFAAVCGVAFSGAVWLCRVIPAFLRAVRNAVAIVLGL